MKLSKPNPATPQAHSGNALHLPRIGGDRHSLDHEDNAEARVRRAP